MKITFSPHDQVEHLTCLWKSQTSISRHWQFCQKLKLCRNLEGTKNLETEKRSSTPDTVKNLAYENETFLAKLQTNMRLYGSYENITET
jgi:hypothetical protein